MAVKKNRAVYQLKICLQQIEPQIWRRVHVWEDIMLPRLHHVFQILFRWENCHLHEFRIGRRRYAEPYPEDEPYPNPPLDEAGIRLSDVVTRVGTPFLYIYDFGDNWRHDVLLEAIQIPEPGVDYPRCIGGERTGPPEDVGGVTGYARYLDILANRHHPEHKDMLRWRGRFEPEDPRLDLVQELLNRRFQRKKRSTASATTVPADAATRSKVLCISRAAKAAAPAVAPAPAAPSVAVELSERERELIIDHTFAETDLTERLQVPPPSGRTPLFRFSLEELDDLAGHVAAEANHSRNRRLRAELDALYERIASILATYAGRIQ